MTHTEQDEAELAQIVAGINNGDRPLLLAYETGPGRANALAVDGTLPETLDLLTSLTLGIARTNKIGVDVVLAGLYLACAEREENALVEVHVESRDEG